jgi:hypothetical protein
VPDGAGSTGRAPRVLRQTGHWVSVASIGAVGALSLYPIRDLIARREAAERMRGVPHGSARTTRVS